MTRLAFISDIHGNREALEATLRDIDSRGADALICLGDVVGYGPDPEACLDIVAGRCDVMIRGNHDEAALRDDIAETFNDRARAALDFTRHRLSPGLRMLIEAMRPEAEIDGVALTHGCFGPRPYRYVWSPAEATYAFEHLPRRIGVVGHTHIPGVFVRHTRADGRGAPVDIFDLSPGVETSLSTAAAVILNPGSVGQPRDRNPDASWGLLDTQRMTFRVHRVTYDIDRVQRRMQMLGLPSYLGERLRVGA